MANHADVLLAQHIHRRLDIATHGQQVVSLDGLRRAALPVAAHFRDKQPVTGRQQRLQLMAPGQPALRKAMQQPQRSTVSRTGAVEAEVDAVDGQQLVIECAHAELLGDAALCQSRRTYDASSLRAIPRQSINTKVLRTVSVTSQMP